MQPKAFERLSSEDTPVEEKNPTFTIGETTRRIYAVVSTKDFTSFVSRCKAEKITVGEAFSELVHQYARGANLIHADKHPKSKSTGADYLKKNP
jgi:hypothetical protein